MDQEPNTQAKFFHAALLSALDRKDWCAVTTLIKEAPFPIAVELVKLAFKAVE